MARGNLVIGAGPGPVSRLLRKLATVVIMLAGLISAGLAGDWLANVRITAAVDGTLRDGAASLSATLANGVLYDLQQRGEAGELTVADAERLRRLPLPDGAKAWLTDPRGRPIGGSDDGAADVCVHGRDLQVAVTRVHAAGDAPGLGAGLDGAWVCSVAPVQSGAVTKGMVVLHRPIVETPVAAILARDLGILTGSLVAIAIGFVLIGIQSMSGWMRRLKAAADRHERNEATANAAGTVLVRLAPHLVYEAETDERVVDLMQTVDVISGRAGTGMRRPLDAGLLLGECLDRRAPELEAQDRELRRAIATDVWVAAEPDRLALAIDHALRNAIDALRDEPGRVEVTMQASRHTVEILIRDTGAEVPRANRHRLFDTGYTTKEGRAGLGLALIRRVAVDHDGYVELRHPWGGGTTLRIVLPRIKQPSGASIEPPPAAPRPLVIPDDAPAEAPVLIMPPPPPPSDERVPDPIPDTIADDFGGIDADDLLGDSDADIPSPPTAIRKRTGAPKHLPPELMEAETMILDPSDKPELPLDDEPAPDPAPEPAPAAEPEVETEAEVEPGVEPGPGAEPDPVPEPEPESDPGPALDDDIEQRAADEMKDFFGG